MAVSPGSAHAVIRTGSEIAFDDLEGAYHRVDSGVHPTVRDG
jgi:hypothetical protein